MAARFLLALALVASIWPFVGGGDAQACSPRPNRPVEPLVELSDRIFVGEALITTDLDSRHRVEVFAVERYLKGEGPRLQTFAWKNICPRWVQEGGTYLVGAAEGVPLRLDNRFTPNEFDSRVAEVERLVLSQEGSLGSFTDDPLPPWATAASFGTAILLGAVLLLGVRRLGSG